MALKCLGCGKDIGILTNLQSQAANRDIPEGYIGSGRCPYCGRKFYIKS